MLFINCVSYANTSYTAPSLKGGTALFLTDSAEMYARIDSRAAAFTGYFPRHFVACPLEKRIKYTFA